MTIKLSMGLRRSTFIPLSSILIIAFCCSKRTISDDKYIHSDPILNFVRENYNKYDSSIYSRVENEAFENYLMQWEKLDQDRASLMNDLSIRNFHVPGNRLVFSLIKGDTLHYFSLSYLKDLYEKELEYFELKNGKYHLIDTSNTVIKFENIELAKIINSEKSSLNISFAENHIKQRSFDKIIELIWLTHVNYDDDLKFFIPLMIKEHPEYMGIGQEFVDQLRKIYEPNSRLAYFSIDNLGYMIFKIDIIDGETIGINQFLIPFKVIYPEIHMD